VKTYEPYLVGSVPLRDASEVMRTLAGTIGPWLRWMPDGETGKTNWIMRFAPVFAQHPAFEPTEKTYRRVHETTTNVQYRLKPGIRAEDVRFDTLPTTAIARESYAEFARLKASGNIPPRTRFQVTIAGINSVVRRFVVEEQQEAISARLEQGLIDMVKRLPGIIPKDELAVQWDIASAVFQYLEAGQPTRFGRTSEEMVDTFAGMHAALANAVPDGADLLLHLCYGDASHRHSIEPSSMKWLVAFTNSLVSKVKRPIQLVHMPVPRNRSDDDYFAPLKDLKLPQGTKLALGLVHYTDGVEGTRKRMAVADRYIGDYLIATECGLGRRPPETIPALLDIHRQAGNLA
jgi:hypothetical protein